VPQPVDALTSALTDWFFDSGHRRGVMRILVAPPSASATLRVQWVSEVPLSQ
jgi:hypothetical protein